MTLTLSEWFLIFHVFVAIKLALSHWEITWRRRERARGRGIVCNQKVQYAFPLIKVGVCLLLLANPMCKFALPRKSSCCALMRSNGPGPHRAWLCVGLLRSSASRVKPKRFVAYSCNELLVLPPEAYSVIGLVKRAIFSYT